MCGCISEIRCKNSRILEKYSEKIQDKKRSQKINEKNKTGPNKNAHRKIMAAKVVPKMGVKKRRTKYGALVGGTVRSF